ncbi:MAG: hypothetical protein DRJ10_03690 [Bacteroidetes bacterium]|nr:MAG: hypothetical protein DRJ10_03690 [Bacteroidota bacterium]
MQMNNTENFNITNMIIFLYTKRKPILIITIFAAIASIIISLVIENEFKSTVVIYPASTSSVSKALLTDMSRAPKDILKFGEEEETEQLMQILHSDEIKAKIIIKYQLMQHYRINLNDKYSKTKLLKEYDSKISFKKTQYQAIEITVYDTDNEMAANIANDITIILDSVYNRVQKERAFMALEIIENQFQLEKEYISLLEDSLSVLRSLGVFDYQIQAKSYTEALTKAIETGNTHKAKLLQEKLDILALYGSSYNSLSQLHKKEIEQLSLLKSKYEEAKVDAYQNLPHKYIVNPAQVSEKKAKPVRWIIVVFSTITAFIFSIFLVLLLDNLQIVKEKLIREKQNASKLA